jgi:hypothetical protein
MKMRDNRDWIVKGINNKFFSVKPHIFKAVYEKCG